jgi:hypothetical protein
MRILNEREELRKNFCKLEKLILKARKKSRYYMLRHMNPKWIEFLDYCYVG